MSARSNRRNPSKLQRLATSFVCALAIASSVSVADAATGVSNVAPQVAPVYDASFPVPSFTLPNVDGVVVGQPKKCHRRHHKKCSAHRHVSVSVPPQPPNPYPTGAYPQPTTQQPEQPQPSATQQPEQSQPPVTQQPEEPQPSTTQQPEQPQPSATNTNQEQVYSSAPVEPPTSPYHVGGGQNGCLWGLNYSPYSADGLCPTADKVASDLRTIAGTTSRIRLYSTDCNQLHLAADAIVSNNLQIEIYAGIWLSDGEARFQKDLEEFIQVATSQAGKSIIKGVSVGNEELYKNTMDEGRLIGYINTVRQRLQQAGLGSIPVYTTESNTKFSVNLANSCDVIQVNIYSVFSVGATNTMSSSVQDIFNEVDRLTSSLPVSAQKPLRVGETGWASEGNSGSSSAPCSLEAESEFFQSFTCQAKSKGLAYFYFEAKDSVWKKGASAMEQSFGIFNANMQPKFSFQSTCSC